MVSCPRETELSLYVAQRASSPNARAIRDHLARCARCREAEVNQRHDGGLAAKLRTVVLRARAEEHPPGPRPADSAVRPAIPGYTIESEIGRGGMGVVYQAIQESTKRIVALKVMLQGPFSSPASRQRFQREIELAAELAHPGVVPVYDSGTHNGFPYFAMQYVEGVSLSEYVAGEGCALRARLDLFLQICSAVSAAHHRGIIHRDLKPSNIMVDPAGHAYVLDFGLAKSVAAASAAGDARTRVSVSGQILGTLPYIAPEQVAGTSKDVDVRTDVYALGVILFELLTGAYPYTVESSVAQTLRAIAETQPRSPRNVAATAPTGLRVDGELEAIVLRALARDKGERYQSAGELARDVERYVRGEAVEARRDSGLYVLRKALVRYRRYVAAAIVLLAAVVTTSLFMGSMYLRIRALSLEAARSGFLEANLDYSQGRYDDALDGLDRSLAQNPELSEAQLLRARALLMMDRRDEAVVYLEDLLERDSDAWAAHYVLAEIHGPDPQRAAYHRERVRRLRPDTAEAFFATSLGLPEREAIAWLTKAIDLDSEHYESRVRRADLLIRAGQYDDAERDAEVAIRLQPGGEHGWWLKAEALLRQRQYAAAVPLFSESVGIRPRYQTLYGRATAHRRLGDHRRAIEDYTAITKLFSDGWKLRWIRYHRATLHWIVGEPDAALADYERFAEYHPDPFWSDVRRGLVLMDLGDADEARRHWQRTFDRTSKTDWLAHVLECLLGHRSTESLLALADTPGKRCEANYYIAERALQARNYETARQFYQACLDTGVDRYLSADEVTPSSEHELAEWRLATLPAR